MDMQTHKAKIAELRQKIEVLNNYPCKALGKIFKEHSTVTSGLRTYCKNCGLNKDEY